MSSAGFAQSRRSGYVEPPLVTAGSDLGAVRAFLPRSGSPARPYSAADVIDGLLEIGALDDVLDDVLAGYVVDVLELAGRP